MTAEIQRENIEVNELNCWPSISESFRVGEKSKQWPLAGEFVKFEYSPKIRQLWRI
jgi:hypothetical protein